MRIIPAAPASLLHVILLVSYLKAFTVSACFLNCVESNRRPIVTFFIGNVADVTNADADAPLVYLDTIHIRLEDGCTINRIEQGDPSGGWELSEDMIGTSSIDLVCQSEFCTPTGVGVLFSLTAECDHDGERSSGVTISTSNDRVGFGFMHLGVRCSCDGSVGDAPCGGHACRPGNRHDSVSLDNRFWNLVAYGPTEEARNFWFARVQSKAPEGATSGWVRGRCRCCECQY